MPLYFHFFFALDNSDFAPLLFYLWLEAMKCRPFPVLSCTAELECAVNNNKIFLDLHHSALKSSKGAPRNY